MKATIAELSLAPGKSMRAHEDVEALRIDHRGLFDDREYMWVEAEQHTRVLYKAGETDEPGHFLSQREDPHLTGITPKLAEEGISLSWHGGDTILVPRVEDNAANRIPVSVWGWNGEAVDQGEQAAHWGREYIGRPVRLVAVSNERPRFVESDPALGRVGFADAYPLTVGSTTSFQKVNNYLTSAARRPIPTNRARTNIILDGIYSDEPEAFPEDYIQSIKIAQDGMTAVLERRKACGRCPIPDTDQVTGERKTYVRSALGKLGRTGTHADTNYYSNDTQLFFTQNFIIELSPNIPKGASITIMRGAEVEVTYSSTTNWIPRKV